MKQNGNLDEESSTSISRDSNSQGSISLSLVGAVVPWSSQLRLGKAQEREVRYGTVVPGWSRASSAQGLFRFSRPAPLCRIIAHWVGLRPAKAPPLAPSPNQLSSTNGHPITHPPLVPRTPAAVVFTRSDCRCHKTVHPSDPIVIRYQVTYWLYSPDQGLFSLPLGLLIICHHRPRPRGGLARPSPLRSPQGHRSWTVESRAPGRRNSLLARLALAQLARLSTTDRVPATITLAVASAATAA